MLHPLEKPPDMRVQCRLVATPAPDSILSLIDIGGGFELKSIDAQRPIRVITVGQIAMPQMKKVALDVGNPAIHGLMKLPRPSPVILRFTGVHPRSLSRIRVAPAGRRKHELVAIPQYRCVIKAAASFQQLAAGNPCHSWRVLQSSAGTGYPKAYVGKAALN